METTSGLKANSEKVEEKEKISLRILLAEDDKNIRDVVTLILEAKGCVVVAVENGELLLDRLATEAYDLVVTDNQMPEVSGIEALRRIRSRDNLKTLPVIVLTGDSWEEGNIISLGGVYLGKPFENEKLYTIIEKLTQKSKATKQG